MRGWEESGPWSSVKASKSRLYCGFAESQYGLVHTSDRLYMVESDSGKHTTDDDDTSCPQNPETQSKNDEEPPRTFQQHKRRKIQDKLPKPERKPEKTDKNPSNRDQRRPDHNRRGFHTGGWRSDTHTLHVTHKALVSYLLLFVSSQGFQLKWGVAGNFPSSTTGPRTHH